MGDGDLPARDAGVKSAVSRGFTKTAWSPQHEVDRPEWFELGRQLGVITRGGGWWIGDWLCYGYLKWGERYARGSKVTGLDPQTLMNMAYVAGRFEPSRR